MKYNNGRCRYCSSYIDEYKRSDLCYDCFEFPGEFTDKILELDGPYFLLLKAIMFFGRKCLEKLDEQKELLNNIQESNERKFRNIEDLFDERLPGRKRDY
jgi:hypothetical protein